MIEMVSAQTEGQISEGRTNREFKTSEIVFEENETEKESNRRERKENIKVHKIGRL